MKSTLPVRLTALAASAVLGMGVLVAQEGKGAKDSGAKAGEVPALPQSDVPALPLEEPSKAKTPTSAEQRLLGVGEALAAANAELESLREQHNQLKLQMEALGIAAVKGDERSLQQRLLKATADLAVAEKARVETVERSNRLAEAAAAFMARPAEPALKTALNDAIKNVTATKSPGTSDAVSLDSARVVSWKSDLGLAVINAGKESGVRMGAPLHITREDKSIASGLVVDVRDRIAGILITGPGATIRVGDGVKPELTQNSPK
jgi:hypothetical protein